MAWKYTTLIFQILLLSIFLNGTEAVWRNKKPPKTPALPSPSSVENTKPKPSQSAVQPSHRNERRTSGRTGSTPVNDGSIPTQQDQPCDPRMHNMSFWLKNKKTYRQVYWSCDCTMRRGGVFKWDCKSDPNLRPNF